MKLSRSGSTDSSTCHSPDLALYPSLLVSFLSLSVGLKILDDFYGGCGNTHGHGSDTHGCSSDMHSSEMHGHSGNMHGHGSDMYGNTQHAQRQVTCMAADDTSSHGDMHGGNSDMHSCRQQHAQLQAVTCTAAGSDMHSCRQHAWLQWQHTQPQMTCMAMATTCTVTCDTHGGGGRMCLHSPPLVSSLNSSVGLKISGNSHSGHGNTTHGNCGKMRPHSPPLDMHGCRQQAWL